MRSRLIDGGVFDDDFVLSGGPTNVTAKVAVAGGDVLLHQVSFYPLTSANLELGVGDVLRIFRSISDQAKEEGFEMCSVEAYRSGGARPGRMMNLSRD